MMFLEGKLHAADNISTALLELDEEYHFLHPNEIKERSGGLDELILIIKII